VLLIGDKATFALHAIEARILTNISNIFRSFENLAIIVMLGNAVSKHAISIIKRINRLIKDKKWIIC